MDRRVPARIDPPGRSDCCFSVVSRLGSRPGGDYRRTLLGSDLRQRYENLERGVVLDLDDLPIRGGVIVKAGWESKGWIPGVPSDIHRTCILESVDEPR